MSQREDSDEIDLAEVFQKIWDGKLTIIYFVIVSVLFVAGRLFFMPPPIFVATTEIKSMPPEQAELYRLSNSADVFRIYADKASRNRDRDRVRVRDRDRDRDIDSSVTAVPSAPLQELYIELLERRHAFRKAFKKFGVLDREDYESDRKYDIAVARHAASIEILPPVNADGRERGEIRRNWSVRFLYNDEKRWLSVLEYVTRITNEQMQAMLKNQFETLLNTEKSKMQFAIEDLKIARDTLITAHTRQTSSELAFLEEQAAIARELQIETHAGGTPTLVARTFDLVSDAASGKRDVISEVTSDEPLYLRGYKSIEKEIALIRSRRDMEPFIEGLREIDQKTDALRRDKSLERAEKLFALTPAATKEGFTAASVSVEATEFEYNKSRWTLMLSLALVGGGMAGIIFVLISNAMRTRREREATAK